MGDSGSQVIGLTLAALGLATSWKVAESTIATLIIPLLVLAIPILDTALVTAVRLVEGRPIHQGGRDHASHRLVRSGISEKGTVVLLTAIAAGLGLTSLAYSGLDNGWVTLVGVLVTFALLVQLAGPHGHRRGRRVVDGRPVALRRILLSPRRLVEVSSTSRSSRASFTIAYLLFVDGSGTDYQKHIFLVSLPAILFARYLCFIPAGLYSGVWRFAGAREAAAIIVAVIVSEGSRTRSSGSRAVPSATSRSGSTCSTRSSRSCSSAPRASPNARCSAPMRRSATGTSGGGRCSSARAAAAGACCASCARRRASTSWASWTTTAGCAAGACRACPSSARSREIDRVLVQSQPDLVLVTIPAAPRDLLDGVVQACERAQVPCRFVRRDLDWTRSSPWAPRSNDDLRRPGGGCRRPHLARSRIRRAAADDDLHLAGRALRVPVLAPLVAVALHRRARADAASRSIAETGEAARRGEPHFFETLYTYLTAPAWWIDSTAQAYDLVRYIGVFTMTAVVFDVLPRADDRRQAGSAVRRHRHRRRARARLLAGHLRGGAAYPTPRSASSSSRRRSSRRRAGGSPARSSRASSRRSSARAGRDRRRVRPRGVLLLPHERRRTALALAWTAWDWIGAVVLTTGTIVFFSAVAGNFSQSWLIATGHYRGRMIEYGVWAGGAFVIGLGVLPVVAALAGLVRPKDEERTPALRAFTALLLAALLCFGLYTAVKASYLSTSFGTVIVERNLIYVIRSSSSAPPSGSSGRGCAGSPGGGHRPRRLPARLGQLRARERPVLGRTRARHRADVQPQPLVHGQRSAVGARS